MYLCVMVLGFSVIKGPRVAAEVSVAVAVVVTFRTLTPIMIVVVMMGFSMSAEMPQAVFTSSGNNQSRKFGVGWISRVRSSATAHGATAAAIS